MKQFKGIYTALISPFVNQMLDGRSLEKLILDQVRQGVDGVVVNGTTGESPTLNRNEIETTFEMVRKLAPNLKLIVGTGSNSTLKAVENTEWAKSLGADAVLIVVPYYNKPTQHGLIQHFATISEKVDIPQILYNVPSRTVTSLSVEAFAKLATFKNIVAIKEASGNIDLLQRLRLVAPADFIFLSGDDSSFVPFILNGGHGAISVASHIAGAEMVSLLKQSLSGHPDGKDLKNFLNLVDVLGLETNPIPIKAACFLKGLIQSAELRLPLTAASEATFNRLKEVLGQL